MLKFLGLDATATKPKKNKSEFKCYSSDRSCSYAAITKT